MLQNTKILCKVLLNRTIPTLVHRQTGSISTAVLVQKQHVSYKINTTSTQKWNNLVSVQSSVVNKVSGEC